MPEVPSPRSSLLNTFCTRVLELFFRSSTGLTPSTLVELVNFDLFDRVGASLEAEDEELDIVSGSANTIDTSGATEFFETAKGSPGATPEIKLVARQVGGRAERVVVDDLLDFEERPEVLIAKSNEERSRKRELLR